MSFGKQAQQLITDPEVYRLFEAVAGKVDAIVELLAEKRRSAVAILKDYTDGLMETMEGQLKPLPPAEEEEEEDEEDEEETDLSSSSNNSDSYQDCIEWTLEESKNSAGDH